MNAAFLWAQLESAEQITERRRQLWRRYHEGLAGLEGEGRIERPRLLDDSEPNGHIYFVLARDRVERDRLIERLRVDGIQAAFQYVPLHSSPAGRRYGRPAGDLSKTERLAGRLLRLPLWPDMSDDQADRVIHSMHRALA